jgi:hypothetical protein
VAAKAQIEALLQRDPGLARDPVTAAEVGGPAAALPAFITAPVRTPVPAELIPVEPEAAAIPAPVAEEAKSAPGVKPVWDVVETWLKGQGGRIPARTLNTPRLIGVAGNPGIAG